MKIVFGILVACGLAVSAAPHAGLASGGLLPDCANDVCSASQPCCALHVCEYPPSSATGTCKLDPDEGVGDCVSDGLGDCLGDILGDGQSVL